MPIDEIAQKVSDRYARAASTGEQMCCPTSYDMANLKSFIPEEVLKISNDFWYPLSSTPKIPKYSCITSLCFWK